VLAGLATLFLLGGLGAQEAVYVCPMDPDIRSSQPGVCPLCGMRLLAGIPDPAEYPMDVAVKPRAPKPRETAKLEFTVRDPWKNHRVKNFQLVHERLFHLFVVSQDLQFFVHGHPTLGPEGSFHFDIAFPEPGMYRVLGDFYPDGASPQLVVESIVVPGAAPPPVTACRRLFDQRSGEHAGGIGHRSTAADRRGQDADVLPADAWRRAGALPGSLGAHAGRQR
jgi:hypothetical protein